jgi:hypothetical protein
MQKHFQAHLQARINLISSQNKKPGERKSKANIPNEQNIHQQNSIQMNLMVH